MEDPRGKEFIMHGKKRVVSKDVAIEILLSYQRIEILDITKARLWGFELTPVEQSYLLNVEKQLHEGRPLSVLKSIGLTAIGKKAKKFVESVDKRSRQWQS